MTPSILDISHHHVAHNYRLHEVVKIKCAPTHVERIIPPGGEAHAFDLQHYRHQVEVYVSPTGRSVRVFIDGDEIT